MPSTTVPIPTAPTASPSPTETSTWRHASAQISSPSSAVSVAGATPYSFRLHYVDVPTSSSGTQSTTAQGKGTILLIHGFPETWYQYRHVINPLANAGYRVIVPDYRGAGNSQAPPSNAGFAGGRGGGYTKLVMADDLHTLVKGVLGIKEKIHVVGHDIGAMIAHAYATWFGSDTKSLVFVDCPLPGSKFYEDFTKTKDVWHFTFHNVEDDLPERLVQGNERTYMRHFFDRLCVNPWAIVPGGEVENTYVLAYSSPGAMRAAFDTYRTFDEDARENQEHLRTHGKSKVPALALAGDGCFNNARAEEQLVEFYESVEKVEVRNSGHYVTDEAPEEFAEKILEWVGTH